MTPPNKGAALNRREPQRLQCLLAMRQSRVIFAPVSELFR
jgi:hypothetical protein